MARSLGTVCDNVMITMIFDSTIITIAVGIQFDTLQCGAGRMRLARGGNRTQLPMRPPRSTGPRRVTRVELGFPSCDR